MGRQGDLAEGEEVLAQLNHEVLGLKAYVTEQGWLDRAV
jgi:hypothetical protein